MLILGTDRNNNLVEIKGDKYSGSIVEISTEHSHIHDGDMFSFTLNFAGVANGAVSNAVFKTPADKYIHLRRVEFYTSGSKVAAALLEAPTNAPAAGTDYIANVINRNRNSINTTAMQTVKHSATINTAGSKTMDSLVFGGNSPLRPNDQELILKPDTWYILSMTNNSGAAADINAYISWYES
jgi:hypothetical protein